MNRSEEITEIAKALHRFQAAVKNPKNNSTNPQYGSSYSSLDEVINTVKPTLAEYGLSFIQSPVSTEDGMFMGVTTLLMHESGQWIESDPLALPAFKLGKGGAKNYDAQAAGIAVTYARRYSLSAMLGISSEDDDDANGISNTPSGNKASEKQLNFVDKLLKDIASKKGISKEEAYQTLKQRLQVEVELEDFTGDDAGKAIKYLQGVLKAQ